MYLVVGEVVILWHSQYPPETFQRKYILPRPFAAYQCYYDVFEETYINYDGARLTCPDGFESLKDHRVFLSVLSSTHVFL